jgi:hypothetical protein
VVKFVERAKGWQGANANAVAKEDLGGTVNPRSGTHQLGPIRFDEVDESVVSTLKSHCPHQEDQHDHIGEEGGEPNNLRDQSQNCTCRGIKIMGFCEFTFPLW